MDDRAAVLAANDRFYRTFERRDIEGMAACWSGTDGDACIHPGWEPVYGHTAVMEAWANIFATGVPMRFVVVDVVVQILGDIARVHNIEDIRVAGDEEVIGRVAVTHLFLRRPGGWRLVLHHGSPIAAEPDADEAAADDEFH
jgi:ketosteroid isomerase-like protein